MANPERNSISGGICVRILALASQKGGSGKTTLSGHLAVQAQLAGDGPVVLIDIDPQGSLAEHELTPEQMQTYCSEYTKTYDGQIPPMSRRGARPRARGAS